MSTTWLDQMLYHLPKQDVYRNSLFNNNSKSALNSEVELFPYLCTSQFQLRSSPPPQGIYFSKKIRSNFRRCGRNPLSNSQRCGQQHSQMPISASYVSHIILREENQLDFKCLFKFMIGSKLLVFQFIQFCNAVSFYARYCKLNFLFIYKISVKTHNF